MTNEIMSKLATLEANQENIKTKMDEHADIMQNHSKLLERLTLTVEKHEQRSTYLEKDVNLREKEYTDRMNRTEVQVREIVEHVHNIQGVGKAIRWVGYIGTAGGVIYAVIYFLVSKGMVP